MDSPTRIRLLAADNNARGDLFTRLTQDLFFALGYDDLRLDVAHSGHEIDIQGRHRFEDRCVIGECKALSRPIGGDAINKLRGLLPHERKRQGVPVNGYFVSLNGFTETARTQEEALAADERLVLTDAAQVIAELQRSRLLVDLTTAAERAGHCARHARLAGAELYAAELLGDPTQGYVWALTYAQGKHPTHCALVHADGTPLAESATLGLIELDRQCGGALHALRYLAPPPPTPDRAALSESAGRRYRAWLEQECGSIQLDGLPADTDLSATRLRLERLFVPLRGRVERPDPGQGPAHDAQSPERPKEPEPPRPIGELLALHPRLAILAAPGGGKSTLLRRLVNAYAAPERRSEVADGLPDRDWLPIYLRCRDLRGRAGRPFLDLIEDLPSQACMDPNESAAFLADLHESLRAGRVLILVDGLDEISDSGDRQRFAQHLRTFLGMFPGVALAVSSREAGFRLVAGVIAGVSTLARLAPFDESEVERLCVSWHVEVVGDRPQVRADAAKLAAEIWANDRIRQLVENPLLLTTLLVVKRWIGELPRNRAALYGKAAQVLIRTWNVEGYAPLDEDETLAQLSYLACTMMQQGIQRIGRRALLALLRQARQELEAELQFASISAEQFIERIEYRSSLIMQTGHELIDGEIQEVYEFRHLTFQEYLAARGFVEGQYPGRGAETPLADLLAPHFEDERWREMIPLAAVLAGRRCEGLIQGLTGDSAAIELEYGYPRDSVRSPVVLLLRQCVLDEVQVTTATLRAALLQLARHGDETRLPGSVTSLLSGKYGALFRAVAEAAYLSGQGCWWEFSSAVANMAWDLAGIDDSSALTPERARFLTQALNSDDRAGRVRAAFSIVKLAIRIGSGSAPSVRAPLPGGLVSPLRDSLAGLLTTDDRPAAMAACWAMALLGTCRLPSAPSAASVLTALYRIMQTADSDHEGSMAAWAFYIQPLLPRDSLGNDAWPDAESFFAALDIRIEVHNYHYERAASVLACYKRGPWSDAEIAARLRGIDSRDYFRPTARDILATLGEPGQRVLDQWAKDDFANEPTR
jgi:hypothetical protein